MGFHMYAEDFLAAVTVSSAPPPFTPVPYYCICRALELGLKSFLLCKDVPIGTLKRKEYGHNLEALLELARAKGVAELWAPTTDEVHHIRVADAYYAGKGFEYFEVSRAVTGYADLPDMAILRRAVGALLRNIKQLSRDVS